MYKKDQCKWFKFSEISEDDETYIKRSTRDINNTIGYCDSKDRQVICTKSVRCVPLDLIEHVPVWVPSRIEAIRKWADRETINTLKIRYNWDNAIKYFDRYDEHPRLSKNTYMREPEDEQPKFLISDGIHRIQRAKELGISCILADVEECIHIKKK